MWTLQDLQLHDRQCRCHDFQLSGLAPNHRWNFYFRFLHHYSSRPSVVSIYLLANPSVCLLLLEKHGLCWLFSFSVALTQFKCFTFFEQINHLLFVITVRCTCTYDCHAEGANDHGKGGFNVILWFFSTEKTIIQGKHSHFCQSW